MLSLTSITLLGADTAHRSAQTTVQLQHSQLVENRSVDIGDFGIRADLFRIRRVDLVPVAASQICHDSSPIKTVRPPIRSYRERNAMTGTETAPETMIDKKGTPYRTALRSPVAQPSRRETPVATHSFSPLARLGQESVEQEEEGLHLGVKDLQSAMHLHASGTRKLQNWNPPLCSLASARGVFPFDGSPMNVTPTAQPHRHDPTHP